MPKPYDLIIAGAGILGTAHAYHALQRGLSVLQLEKDQVPREATVRNFGQVVPSGLAAGEWQQYGRRSLQIYKAVQREFDLSIRQLGSTYIASNDQEVQLLEELIASTETNGYTAERWSSDQCRAYLPGIRSEYCKAALHFPEEISVEPTLMIHRFHQYLQRKFDQYDFRTGLAVTACEAGPGGVQVTTHNGERYKGGYFLLCGGREFKLLFPDVFQSSGLVISKLQMLCTRPLPQVQLPGNILTGLTIRRYESFTECPSFQRLDNSVYDPEYFKWGIHILFKQMPDGRIIIGDSHEYAGVAAAHRLSYQQNEWINTLILNEARRIVELPDWSLSATWSGYYTQHPEKALFEYRIDDRIHIVTGIGGKGMTSSLGFAEENLPGII